MHCLAARRKLKQYLAAIPLVAAPTIASSAAATPTVLADCHAITEMVERLACYDRESGRPADPANPPTDAAAKPKR